MQQWFNKSEDEIWKHFQVEKGGMSSQQAVQRLEEHGKNILQENKKKGLIRVFLEQFCDLLVIILIVAAVISMLSDNVHSTIVIFTVIILNAVLGTVQHFKAEKSLDSLKSLSSPHARVLRDGHEKQISSEDIVPGDILLLEAGDLVVADGRILESFSLQINESSLTGESTSADKNADRITEEQVSLGDQTNMVFSGSLVTYGRGVILVTETGMDTQIGKIASLMNAAKEKKTPLQISLDDFSKKYAMIIIGICTIIFFFSVYRSMQMIEALMFAVALAVAAIPEALGSIVTIVQALGTQKMVQENAIMKELNAVESLGCVSVICSDKTGTLTQNKMTVQQVYTDGKIMDTEGLTMEDPVLAYLLYNMILTNDSVIADGRGIGDPTEFALIEAAMQVGIDVEGIRKNIRRLEELPFDSDRKLMSTKHSIDGKSLLFTKGAVDVLLEKITHILTLEGKRPIQQEDLDAIVNQNMAFSADGLRVLAFVYKELEREESITMASEDHYTFIGLLSLMDPPREESKAAVMDARKAGIKTIMITGDHKVTASAIAAQIGIWEDGGMAVTGIELDAMSEEELNGVLEKISVYARVSPEHKIRIVDAWQRKGHIVAMTGDGVNDAPALKQADIGVAMGITGTEVSKDAAAMILMDDNFATIIKAVANGRKIYRNIKNSVMFLLSGNMAGIFGVLYTFLLALPMPFAAVHLLFINLLTDSLPAIAIGMEAEEKETLSVKPRNPKEGILTKNFLAAVFMQGAIIAVFTMIAYHIGLRNGGAPMAATMAFYTLTLSRLFHGFNCRSNYSLFKIGIRSNWYSVMAFGAGIALLSCVMFIPFLQGVFSVVVISWKMIAVVYLLSVFPTVIIQLSKVVRERLHAK